MGSLFNMFVIGSQPSRNLQAREAEYFLDDSKGNVAAVGPAACRCTFLARGVRIAVVCISDGNNGNEAADQIALPAVSPVKVSSSLVSITEMTGKAK